MRKAISLIDAAVRLWGQVGLNAAAYTLLHLLILEMDQNCFGSHEIYWFKWLLFLS